MAATALDRNDRTHAILVWACLPIGGWVLPVVFLALTWNQRSSLARRESMIALITVVAAFVGYVPFVLWAYAFGGGDRVFYISWSVMAASTAAMIVRGLVVTLRAEVADAPQPAPPWGGPPDGTAPPPGVSGR